MPLHGLDTASAPAKALMHADFDDPAVVDAAGRLEEADSLIVATPVNKAAFSRLLMCWLELLLSHAEALEEPVDDLAEGRLGVCVDGGRVLVGG
jgi:NAD(P)H-dependent FMN reductase